MQFSLVTLDPLTASDDSVLHASQTPASVRVPVRQAYIRPSRGSGALGPVKHSTGRVPNDAATATPASRVSGSSRLTLDHGSTAPSRDWVRLGLRRGREHGVESGIGKSPVRVAEVNWLHVCPKGTDHSDRCQRHVGGGDVGRGGAHPYL